MDNLAQMHQKHANSRHVSRPDLIQKLAAHAIRKVPQAHTVLRRNLQLGHTRPVTQCLPVPYNNDGTMQMMNN